MDWYYVEENQRRGPVTEEQLVTLIQQGTVRSETLVWHSGMANWLPCGEVHGQGAGAPPTAESAAPSPVTGRRLALAHTHGHSPTRACTECGRNASADELIAYHGAWVCAACKDAFFQKLKEGVPVSNAFVYAGFWIRVLAKIVDQLILGAVNFVLFMGLGILIGLSAAAAHTRSPGHFSGTGIAVMVLVYIVSIFLPAFYSGYFLSRHGATPGKMACGLQVIRANGETLTFWRGFGRTFAEMLSALILCIGYIMVAFDDQKRALHDHICDTRVIRK